MTDTVAVLDLGKTSAKYASTDELLQIMRHLLREQEGISHHQATKLWLDQVREHEDYETVLLPAIERYVANALWRRCVIQAPGGANRLDEAARETKAHAKDIIAAEIVLWTWKLPITGKPLCESTFQEVAEAAPLAGRFLSKLSMQGAPGSLVREVFTKSELQDFWAAAQG